MHRWENLSNLVSCAFQLRNAAMDAEPCLRAALRNASVPQVSTGLAEGISRPQGCTASCSHGRTLLGKDHGGQKLLLRGVGPLWWVLEFNVIKAAECCRSRGPLCKRAVRLWQVNADGLCGGNRWWAVRWAAQQLPSPCQHTRPLRKLYTSSRPAGTQTPWCPRRFAEEILILSALPLASGSVLWSKTS